VLQQSVVFTMYVLQQYVIKWDCWKCWGYCYYCQACWHITPWC